MDAKVREGKGREGGKGEGEAMGGKGKGKEVGIKDSWRWVGKV